jgi:hypothetical protein
MGDHKDRDAYTAAISALRRREGEWKSVPHEHWRQTIRDLDSFCEMGWARLARQLGWEAPVLYGVVAEQNLDGTKCLNVGLVGRLQGGSIMMLSSKSVVIRWHHCKTTVELENPIYEAA